MLLTSEDVCIGALLATLRNLTLRIPSSVMAGLLSQSFCEQQQQQQQQHTHTHTHQSQGSSTKRAQAYQKCFSFSTFSTTCKILPIHKSSTFKNVASTTTQAHLHLAKTVVME